MALPPWFAAIGSDHYRSADALVAAVPPHADMNDVAAAWCVYLDQFGGFCGSRLDPQFWRHDHPARHAGAIQVDAGSTVVIVGVGPSLARQAAALKRLRSQVLLFTSLRGAEALAALGLVPDLALVEHQTALGAQVTVSQVRDRGCRNVLDDCPWVAADARTPPELIVGVPADRLFVPEPLPTWGLWPATAVALALMAGASRVALLGLDLGTPIALNPTERPLASLLALLSRIGSASFVDCGADGAYKEGWPRAALETVAEGRPQPSLEIVRRPWTTRTDRLASDRAELHRLGPTIARAGLLLRHALKVRAEGQRAGDPERLKEATREMLGWGDVDPLRIGLQDTLGLSLLPALWGTGIDERLGARLWRPVVLALQELVHQAATLQQRLAADRMGRLAC